MEPKFFFRKDQKKHFWIFFLNLHVPGYTKIQKNNFENFFFDLSEKKILVPICKKLNNFCLDDGKKRFLEKKIYFHKHVLLDDVFFLLGGSDGGGTFRLYFWNLHKIWSERSIDLSSVRFGLSCDIGWVTSGRAVVDWPVTMLGMELPNSQGKTKLAASIYPDPLLTECTLSCQINFKWVNVMRNHFSTHSKADAAHAMTHGAQLALNCCY